MRPAGGNRPGHEVATRRPRGSLPRKGLADSHLSARPFAAAGVSFNEPAAFPSPLWGRARDGGSCRCEMLVGSAPTCKRRDPPPLAPPHKGEGIVSGSIERDVVCVTSKPVSLFGGKGPFLRTKKLVSERARSALGLAAWDIAVASPPTREAYGNATANRRCRSRPSARLASSDACTTRTTWQRPLTRTEPRATE